MSRIHVYTVDDPEADRVEYHATLEEAVAEAEVVMRDKVDDDPVEILSHRVVSMSWMSTARRTAILLGGSGWCDRSAVVWRDGETLPEPEVE